MGSLEFFSLDCGYLVIVIMAFVGLMQSTSYMLWITNRTMTFALEVNMHFICSKGQINC